MIRVFHPGSGSWFFFTHPGSRGQKGTGSRIRNTGFKSRCRRDFQEWRIRRKTIWKTCEEKKRETWIIRKTEAKKTSTKSILWKRLYLSPWAPRNAGGCIKVLSSISFETGYTDSSRKIRLRHRPACMFRTRPGRRNFYFIFYKAWQIAIYQSITHHFQNNPTDPEWLLTNSVYF